jgi:two-component system NtrC family sensor kinase
LRISVRDNGVGIAPEKLQEIFKPFMSTKGARGTGLGLAVSRKVLREHGGDILVESEKGKGSSFILRLPAKSLMSSDPNITNPELPAIQPPEDFVSL